MNTFATEEPIGLSSKEEGPNETACVPIGSEIEAHDPPRRRPGPGWRAVITAGVAILAVASCVIVGTAFYHGSWWYYYGTDRPMNAEDRTRVEAIRDDLAKTDVAPRAVVWLDTALDPHTDPSAVHDCLLTAQDILEATGDPSQAQTITDLKRIAARIHGGWADIDGGTKPIPSPLPSLETP